MVNKGDIVDGRYQIIREIGKGGGGIVFLATHLSLKQQVVLKQIKNASGYDDPEALRNEVDILKRLKHPALPQVYDFLTIDGMVFTAMEYIPGYSLQEYINAGQRFQEFMILKWARQLAEILDYMHTREQPVIHRDIKPSNIMLKPDGNVSLIDFNISDNTATAYGVSGYSKGFASPEQLEKGRLMEHRIPSDHITIDERSDIYSLGAVVYYLLCGQKPADEYISLESMNCCMYPLAVIVDKCLRKNKKERYQTAAELLYALNHLEKTDRQYLKYAWIQRLSITLSIFLITAGIGLVLFGRMVMSKTAYEEAYEDVRVAVEKKTDDIAVKINRVLSEEKWETYLTQNPREKARLYYWLGRYYSDMNYNNAVDAFEKALQYDESNEEIYSAFITCCLNKNHQHPDRAREIIKKARKVGMDNADLKMWDAQVSLADGDYQQAVTQLEEIISGDYGLKMKEEASSYYVQACMELNEYDKAKEVLETKKEKLAVDYMNLSQIYLAENRWTKSKETLLEAAGMEPDNPRIYIRLGLLSAQNHDLNSARYYYDRVRELTGDEEYPEDFMEEYDQLRTLVE